MIINPADLASDKPVTFINPLEYGSLIGLFFIYIFLSQGFISVKVINDSTVHLMSQDFKIKLKIELCCNGISPL